LQLSIPTLIPRVFLASLVFGLLFHIQQTILSELIIAQKNFQIDLIDIIQRIINWTGIFMLWSLFYFIVHFVENYKKEEIKNLKWEAMKSELELNKLKSQLNPHFIFNTMNSIRALIEENPAIAKNAVTQLSNILRSTLLMSRKKFIKFEEEINLVEDYLNLEKIRLEERLKISMNIQNNTKSIYVPPMMIQTLVENGIKHGVAKKSSGGELSISAHTDSKYLIIKIENTGQLIENNTSETGFGIINTQQRLKILYANNASFQLYNSTDINVTAILKIPIYYSENICEL
jgi:LytS/YehU family sensor histidine kinase